MNALPPARLRRGRQILAATGAVLLAILVTLFIWEGGIPWGIDFSKVSADEADPFGESVLTLVWWCLLFNLLLLAGLWVSMPSWIGFPTESLPGTDEPNRERSRAVLVSALLAAALLAVINAPRLGESLWNDEIWSLRESIHGSWDRDLDSREPVEVLTEIYWEPIGWEHAIWRYETTNHHYLLNISQSKTGTRTEVCMIKKHLST